LNPASVLTDHAGGKNMPHITLLQPKGRARYRYIHARIDLFVAERKISKKAAQKAKSGEEALLKFARQYDVSLDWLVIGDLRGLLRTTRRQRDALRR
jgi:hypothetical protein